MRIDEKSFNEIYDAYFESICRFLNRYTQDVYLIEDVVQEVFVNLWTERSSKEIKYIKTYLFRSARNRILNNLRDQDNRTTLLNDWHKRQYNSRDERDCVDEDEFIIRLQQAVACLPNKCREIFMLSCYEKLSYKEIAEVQNISIKTVENQLNIALKKLRIQFLK
jgi:RNA polymerase sigma-70 factor (ECF subfamily)